MSLSRSLLSSALLALMASSQAMAASDDLADVQRLQAAGQTQQALQRVEALLSRKPKDAALRFLNGVLLAEGRRHLEALEVFNRLSADFPELPEPYNNSAALYAAMGDFERAKSALEQAVRANPAFSTAHENLGDVYATLAGQSYSRALRIEPGNTALQGKLALVRQLAPSSSTAPSTTSLSSTPR